MFQKDRATGKRERERGSWPTDIHECKLILAERTRAEFWGFFFNCNVKWDFDVTTFPFLRALSFSVLWGSYELTLAESNSHNWSVNWRRASEKSTRHSLCSPSLYHRWSTAPGWLMGPGDENTWVGSTSLKDRKFRD